MELAKSDGCLAGKWMVFCDPTEADGMWEKIAVATAHGKLPRKYQQGVHDQAPAAARFPFRSGCEEAPERA
jgi:hypothetical protein